MAKKSCELECEMTEFTSEIKTISHNRQVIYNALSNMENLAKVKERISYDKIQDLTCDHDSCSFSMSPLGRLRMVIVDREAPATVKFTVEGAPVNANLFVRLIPENENETQMQLCVETNLNPFLRSMVEKPLQEGINKIADMLTVIPYGDLQE